MRDLAASSSHRACAQGDFVANPSLARGRGSRRRRSGSVAVRRAVEGVSRAALGFGSCAEPLEARLLLAGNVVINELMYHASSQNVGDEWVELYNKGGASVDLSGWHFGKGIGFTFAAGTTLGAGQYLVVAHDLTRFHANYPSVANVVGGWTGQLGNNGEDRKSTRLNSS